MSDEPKAKRKPGRPPEPVNWDIGEQVIQWLADGGSLLNFCKQPGMPSRWTVYDWCDRDSEFALQFARARELGAAALVDMAQDVADDGRNDTQVDDDGRVLVNHDIVQRSKLRVDTLMKRAACFCPALFGTRIQVGGDGGHPIKVESKVEGPTPPSGAAFDAWASKLASILTDRYPDDAC